MRFRLILLGFFIVNIIKAAYLENVPRKLVQPDGEIVNCFATGTEYHNWLHDADGYTIIKNHETGYYTYAVKSGSKVIASDYIVGKHTPSKYGIEKGINLSDDIVREKRQKYINLPDGSLKNSSLKASGFTNLNNIVVFIRFSDQSEFTKKLSEYDNMLNGLGKVTMQDYYKTISANKLNVTGNLFPESESDLVVSYKDSHPRSYYNENMSDSESTSREHTLVENALNHVKSHIPSSLNIDNNNDGKVDNIIFIIRGAGGDWNSILWPHQWVLYTKNVEINGKQVYNYNVMMDEGIEVGTMCHEMFHSLGAPDYYHYNESSYYPVAKWDLMAHNQSVPQNMLVYTKMKYGGWLDDIPVISTAGRYSLTPTSESPFSAYKIPVPNTENGEYLVLEYRKPQGFYDNMGLNNGLIIYRISPYVEGNQDGPPDEIYVYRPNGNRINNGFPDKAAFASNHERTQFDDFTNPYSFILNKNNSSQEIKCGFKSGFGISNVSETGDKIFFDYDGGIQLYADFKTNYTNLTTGESISFTNYSNTPSGTTISSYEWTFEGGNPASYSGETPPEITYSSMGNFDVSLIITNSEENKDTLIKKDYIKVISGDYCSSASLSSTAYISNFTAAGETKLSPASLYSDFTSTVISVNRNVQFNVSITNGNPSVNCYAKCFIDWNSDKDFIDQNESYVMNYSQGTASVTISVPAEVSVNRNTRLRVVLSGESVTSPCGNIDNGEIEDYTLRVVNSIPVIQSQANNISIVEDNEYIVSVEDLNYTDAENDDVNIFVAAGDNYTFSQRRIIPDANFFGTLTVPVFLRDEFDQSDLFNLTIVVTSENDAPVIESHKDVEMEGNYNHPTFEPLAVSLDMLNFNDPDDSAEDIEIVLIDDEERANYTIDSQNNSITPELKFLGDLSVKLKIKDDSSAESDAFKMTVKVVKPTDVIEEYLKASRVNCYPNPFNTKTNIVLNLDKSIDGELKIFDTSGNVVYSFFPNKILPQGYHYFSWDGKNNNGEDVSAGVYIVSLISDERIESSRIIYIK